MWMKMCKLQTQIATFIGYQTNIKIDLGKSELVV